MLTRRYLTLSYETTPKWHGFFSDQTGRLRSAAALIIWNKNETSIEFNAMPQGSKYTMNMIRPFEDMDWAGTWRILEPVFRAGESYPFSPDITEEDAYKVWIEIPSATYVSVDKGNEIFGTYYIKPNQPTLGAHVCNCGYIVSESARGKGIASAMCEHSQREAITLGFKSMQYNLVVSTNVTAIHLWEKQGFEVIGTLPEAFRHPQLGFVDALVMYKKLQT